MSYDDEYEGALLRYSLRGREGEQPTVPLYRGDDAEYPTLSLDKASVNNLFGQGFYFSNKPRIAGDYGSKNNTGSLMYNYGKTTKADAEDKHVRRIARGIDDAGEPLGWTAPNPSEEDIQRRTPVAQALWAKHKKDGWAVRKTTLGEVVVIPPDRRGVRSTVLFPQSVLDGTYNVEHEIDPDVEDALADTLREHGDHGTAKEMRAFIRQYEQENDQPPSFRDVWGSIDGASPLHTPEGNTTFRRKMRDLGYTGLQYDGGKTMGGQTHRAYVFWDEQGLKKLPRTTKKM